MGNANTCWQERQQVVINAQPDHESDSEQHQIKEQPAPEQDEAEVWDGMTQEDRTLINQLLMKDSETFIDDKRVPDPYTQQDDT